MFNGRLAVMLDDSDRLLALEVYLGYSLLLSLLKLKEVVVFFVCLFLDKIGSDHSK